MDLPEYGFGVRQHEHRELYLKGRTVLRNRHLRNQTVVYDGNLISITYEDYTYPVRILHVRRNGRNTADIEVERIVR